MSGRVIFFGVMLSFSVWLLAAGCEDDSASLPVNVAGTWIRVDSAGEPIATLNLTQTDNDIAGTYTRISATSDSVDAVTGATPETDGWTAAITGSLDGDRITLTYADPDRGAVCLEGSVTPDEMSGNWTCEHGCEGAWSASRIQ